jgi:hypothetical protein
MAKDHPHSVILPHCFVCEVKFVGEGGTEQRHDHHIFPRAYGGVDGPEVSLCDGHHSAVHRIAECLIREKPHHQFLRGESPTRIKRLMYMATRIHQMWLATKDDPNKATSVSFVLTAKTQKMIDQLKPVLGLRSREAVLLAALDALHRRHFVN